ncbi:MAG: 4-(cytidine 5'-diphospho)-2-C-methyl-D-erythritol kinase [Deltaproteobacteria bacterium]|nr:4-(cytidine 5'-diphospho)-2-C-methyl-D-erythritol kinase [Deltaproteobacteria bacterium]
MKSIRLRSPAKINLFLRVLGKRTDGYHEIETLFQEIDLADFIILKRTDGPKSIEVFGAPGLETSDNIVFKSLRWLENLCGQCFNIHIELHKEVPVAAGLGGGSSNAAAVILGVKELFDLDWLDIDAIRSMTAAIGADVPFFLHGGSAIGEGVGEKLTRIFLDEPEEIVLVNPGFPVSTAKIFGEISKTLTGQMRPGILQGLYGESRDARTFLHNDLQPVAERLHPGISEALEALRMVGIVNPLMSGSGPTVFGFLDKDTSEFQRMSFPEPWKVIVTRPAKKGITID